MDGSPTAAAADGPAPRMARVATRDELPALLTNFDLRDPRPVVVLVGGAGGLEDADLARLRPLFDEGLAPVVEAVGACVIDGGTDAGVMALIGQARAKLGATFPLIGVVASGTIEPPANATTTSSAPSLEPNHTHVVLVPGSQWGDESPWLTAIAAELAGDDPSVTVVVNGGEVTVDDAIRSVDAGRPVLVVAGSRRAADTMAGALLSDTTDKRVKKVAASGLLEAVHLREGPHSFARAVAAVLTTEHVTPPPTASRDDWLRADFHALITMLRLSKLQRQFLRSRWFDQLNWVEGRASHNRDRYYVWRLITIIGGITVPALVTLNVAGSVAAWLTWTTFAVSLLVAISAAVEEFFRYGERWRHYRRTAEMLKTEGWQFFQLTGHYRRYHTHAAAYPAFAGRVEDILQQDVDAYITTVAAEPSSEQPSKPDGSE